MSDIEKKDLKTSDILIFWIPLAIMQVVMAFEMPAINAVISRMEGAKENLAIFGVVFALSLLIEGPIIQMLSAATAISDSYTNYKRLSSFLFAFLCILTSIHLFCAMPGPFRIIADKILNLDEEFIHPAEISFLIMLPWTPAIGYRRMWQGVLIKEGRTYSVSAITVIRLTVTCTVLLIGFIFTDIKGCYIAAAALSSGVTAGAVAAGSFAVKTLRKKKEAEKRGEAGFTQIISMKKLIIFYLPLAMTSFVTEADRPIIAAGITRGLLPMESLAAWPVIISIVSLFRSIPLSTQEAAIALLGDKKGNLLIRRIIFFIGAVTGILFLLSAFTEAGRDLFLLTISGLPENLAEISVFPLILISPVFIAIPIISWKRAVNIKRGTTRNIAFSVAVNLITVFATIIFINSFFTIRGITTAVLSYAAALSAEASYLLIKK